MTHSLWVIGNSKPVETYSGHHWKINSGRLIDNFLGFKIENQWNWSIFIRDDFNLKSVYEFLQWFLLPTNSQNDFDDYRWEINYKRLWNYFRSKSHKKYSEPDGSEILRTFWDNAEKCWENADIFSVVKFSSSREPLNPAKPDNFFKDWFIMPSIFCHHFFVANICRWQQCCESNLRHSHCDNKIV